MRILFLLLLAMPLNASEKSRPWTGHVLRGNLGSTMNFEIMNGKDLGAEFEPYFQYGYEYGFQFAPSWFAGGGLTWTIAYPRNFVGGNNGAFAPPIGLWWIPMTHVDVGYVFSNHLLVTVGMVFVWAVAASVRYPILPNLFVEFNSIMWLDRVFDRDGFFGKGFDNFHAGLGFGYKF